MAEGRARVRRQFERQALLLSALHARGIREAERLRVLNLMTLKGTMQLIEVHNRWTQRLHIMRWWDEEEEAEKWLPEQLPKEMAPRAKDALVSGQHPAEPVVSPFLQSFLSAPSERP